MRYLQQSRRIIGQTRLRRGGGRSSRSILAVFSFWLVASLAAGDILNLEASCPTPVLRSSSFLRGQGAGVVADLNGDGRFDVAFCGASQITTYLGGSRGSFTKGPASPGVDVMKLAAGDFNKDGKIDLVGTDAATDSLVFFRGLGGGVFSTPNSTKLTQSGVRGLAVADFNSDGRLDVACANEWSGTVSVLAGNGQGGFTVVSHTQVGGQPKWLVAADVNRDQKPDVVVCGVSSFALIGDGRASFPKISAFSSGGAGVSAVAVADLNGDGSPDLAATSGLSRLLSLVPGDGQGDFGSPIILRTGRDSTAVAAADFNADGIVDIITTEGILLGEGGGQFRELPALGRNESGGELVVADFSDDHILDLLHLADGGTLLLGDGEGGLANNTGLPGRRLAAADLDEDGYEDIVKTSSGISIFLGSGSGIFTHPRLFEAGRKILDVVINDFNNDGHRDIAAADGEAPGQIVLLLGDGHGDFTPARLFDVGGPIPWSVNAADFDGDGKMDLAVCAQQSDVIVFYGDGKGGFSDPSRSSIGLVSNPSRFVADDLNRDGKADLALLDERGGISVLLSQGRAFSSPVQLATDVGASSVAVGDLDSDGNLDLITATTTSEGLDRVAVFLGNGAAQFSAPSFYPAPKNPSDLVLFDANHDGRLDISVAGSEAVAIMLGDGTGKLGASTYFESMKSDSVCLVAADVNGDHGSDLLIGGPISFFSVLVNDCPAGSHFYFPQVAAGSTASAGVQTELELINTGPEAEVTVDFIDEQGDPMTLSFDGYPAGPHLAFRLKSGQHYSMVSSTDGPLKVGYAEVRSEGNIGGTAVYRYSENGEVLYEAGVPAAKTSRDMTFYARSGGDQASAIALLNSSSLPANATFRLYGPSSQLLATRSAADLLGGRPLKPMEHLARFVFELFPDSHLEQVGSGTVTTETDQPLSAVSLQLFNGPSFPATKSLTVIPVSSSRADHPSGSLPYERWYFPQIADGSQGNLTVSTRMLFFNAGSDCTLRLDFYHSDGSPMQVDLADRGRASQFEFQLGRGNVWSGETKGADALRKGYAVVTAAGSVSASAVFVYRQDGSVTGETSVPGVKSQKDCWLMVPENNTARMAGIALVNRGLSAATVRLTLYDKTLKKVAERQLLLGAGTQSAQFASELFEGVAADAFSQATIRLESDQPLAAITVLQSHRPSAYFPEGRYLLTLLPVEPE